MKLILHKSILFSAIVFCLQRTFTIAQVLPLDSVLSRVEINNPALSVFITKSKSLDEMSKGARAWMPPTIAGGLDRMPYMLMKNEGAGMLSAEQMIPNPKKLSAKEEYLKSLSVIEENNLGYSKNQLIAEAKKMYYMRMMNERKLKVAKESEQLMRFMIAVAEARYAYEKSDLGSIYKAKANLSRIWNMKTMMEGMIQESTVGLNALMNQNLDTQFEIDTMIRLKNYSPAKLVSNLGLLQSRSDIKRMENSIAAMKLSQTAMSLERKPDFGIRFDHMMMFGMPNQFSLMGMMTLPIVPWASKMYRATVSAMNFEIEAMQKERESMLLMSSRMLAEYQIQLENEKKQIQNYEQHIIPELKKNYQVQLNAYEQNTGDLFRLLDAWEILLMAQMEYLEHLEKAFLLEADYEKEIEQR